MLFPLQIWYFSLVVDWLSTIDVSSRSWICFELMGHRLLILMLQLLVVPNLLTWQDHLRWLLKALQLIRLSCFDRVDALSWIRRRIWSTRRSVWELWLKRQASYFLVAQRVCICIFARVPLTLTQDSWHSHKGRSHASDLLWPSEAKSGTSGKVLLLAHLTLPGNFRNSSRRKWRPFCLQHSLHHLLGRQSLILFHCLRLWLLLHGLEQIRDIGQQLISISFLFSFFFLFFVIKLFY